MKKISKALLCLLAVAVMFGAVGCGRTQVKVKVVEIKLTTEQYAFAVSKSDTVFKTAANELLASMKTDGSWQELYSKYITAEDLNAIDATPITAKSTSSNRSKELVVATNAEFAPFEYKKGDGYLGLDMEIAKKLAEKMGRELVILNIDFEAVVTSVNSGDADIGMAGLTVNEEREKSVTFTDSYIDATQVIIVKEDDKTFDGIDPSANDAAEKAIAIINAKTNYRVGAQAGTTGYLFAKGDKAFGYKGFNKDNVKVTALPSGSLAVQDMINGNLDMVILDILPAKSIVAAINK